MIEICRETLKKSGWRMGACFTYKSAPALFDKLGSDLRSDNDVCISITHDCSVINPSLEAEPVFEYLLARRVSSLNGNFTHTKNQRKLHINILIDGDACPYEIKISDRYFVDRSLLLQSQIEKTINLDKDSHASLVRWLGNRYMAQALPDGFEKRIDKIRDKLKKLFDRAEANSMLAIYMMLDPIDRDIDENEKYKLTVALVYEEKGYRTLHDNNSLDAYAGSIKSLLEKAPGIDVGNVFALSEKDFSLYQMRRMVRWRFDHHSFKSQEDVELIEDP